MGGASKVASNVSNINRGGAKATNADISLNYIKENKLSENDTAKEKQANYDKIKVQMLEKASKNIQAMDANKRANYLKSLERTPLRLNFNADGTLNYDTQNSDKYNKEAYSNNLRGVENKLRYKPIDSAVKIDEKITKTKQDIEKILGDNANVVIFDDKDLGANGFYDIDDGIIYISSKADMEKVNAGEILAVHEVAHTLEGTKEYNELHKLLLKGTLNNDKIIKKYGKYIDKFENTAKLYDNASNSEEKQLYINQTEVVSQYLGEMLGNDEFIEKIANSQKGLATKIFTAIKKVISGKNKAKIALDGDISKYLNKLAKKYEKAITSSVGGVKLSSSNDDKDPQDRESKKQYNKKAFSFQYENFPGENEVASEAHRLAIWWAKQPTIETGDQTLISMNDRWYLVEKFDDADNGYQVEDYITNTEYNKIFEEIKRNGRSGQIKSIQRAFTDYGQFDKRSTAVGGKKSSVDSIQTQHDTENSKVLRVDKVKSQRRETSSNGDGNSKGGSQGKQGEIRFSLKESVEKDILSKYGKTYRWVETGYIYKDGTKIDLSGRNEGAPGGYRTVDHRDIFDVYEDSDIQGSEAMVEFMARGNIRVMPESPGINLQVEPTEAQYTQIQNLVENLGWKEKEFSIDFDNSNGDTVDNLHYEGNVSARKVISDIKYYFKAGKTPYKSEFSDFRYSRKDSDGNALTQEQIDFFKDSKVRDDEGNLQVVYHSTPNKFYKFRKGEKDGLSGKGIYFARESSRLYGSRVIKAYLNIINPMTKENEPIGAREINNVGQPTKIITDFFDKFPQFDGIIGRQEIVVKQPNQIKLTTNKTPTESLDIRYSLKPFAEQVDQTLKNVNDRYRDIFVMDTPQLLQDIGLDNLPMLMTAKHIRSINLPKDNDKHHHGVPVDIIKDIPNMIKTPVMVMESLTKSDSVVIIGERLVDNEPMLIAVRVDGKGVENKVVVDSNFITSAYGRHNFDEFIQKNIKNNTILFIDKKRSQELFSVLGVQFPEGFNNLDFNTIIRTIDKKSQEKIKNNSKNDDIRYSLSDGEAKKLVANHTKAKVYSKKDAEIIINNIIDETLIFDENYGVMSGKNKDEVIDMLWVGLNSEAPGKREEFALKIADYIIKNSIVQNIFEDNDNLTGLETINILKDYFHLFDLSYIKDEIKYKYGNNSPYLLWGKKVGTKGCTADVLGKEIVEKGLPLDEITEAGIFFEIDEKYKKAMNGLKKKADILLERALDSEEKTELTQKIVNDILQGYKENGAKSRFAKLIEYYQSKIKKATLRNSLNNQIIYEAQQIRDIKNGTFQNASEVNDKNIFKNTILKLANIKFSGDINKSGTRKIIAKMGEWYKKDNPLFQALYNEEIAEMINFVATGKEETLKIEELSAVKNILIFFRHAIKDYNKVFRNGKYVDALPLAEQYIKLIQKNKYVGVGWIAKAAENNYLQFFSDPLSVARKIDNYGDGFCTMFQRDLQRATIDGEALKLELNKPLEEFYKKNKGYDKRLEKKIIFNEKEIMIGEAISLYMTLKQENAEERTSSGFKLDKNRLSFEKDEMPAKDELYKKFNEQDKKLIEIVETQLKRSSELKYQTDMARQGYSNIIQGYYFPTRSAIDTKNIDSTPFNDINRVTNMPFNKERVKGAKGQILIGSIQYVISKHLKGIADYCSLASVLDEFNILFNLDVGGNKNNPLSIKTQLDGEKINAEKYFKQLISDAQGITTAQNGFDKAVGYVRKSYAIFQLASNLKVLLTQFSSYFSAFIKLKFSSLVKAFMVNGANVDNYCKLAKIRNENNSAVMAQGVLDKIGKVANLLMKPIGKVDRLVIRRLFSACQIEVASTKRLGLGTEENKIEAGKLLEEVILDTQQNSLATERSAEHLRNESK